MRYELVDKRAAPGPERTARMRAMAEAGASYAEIGEAFGVSRSRVAQLLGPVPRGPYGGEWISVKLRPESRAKLRQLAMALGLQVPQGAWRKNGSLTLLLEAIADGRLEVRRKPGHGPGEGAG